MPDLDAMVPSMLAPESIENACRCVSAPAHCPVHAPPVGEVPEDVKRRFLLQAEIALHRSACDAEVCPGHGLAYRKLAEAALVALAEVAPLIAPGVRAEERQRIETLRADLNHLLRPIIGMARARLAHPDMQPLNLEYVVERLYCALDAASYAVGEPSATDFDRDAYQRQGMQNPRATGSAVPVPVATPIEPVDEVVCPNCEATIRARMSDATGPCTSECGKPADETCLRWACRNVGADLAAPAEQDGQR